MEEVEEHRLVVHEDELRVLGHEVEHRGEAAPGLVAGMQHPPEPADIEMGVADGGDQRLLLEIGDGIDLCGDRFGGRQRCPNSA